MELDIRDTILRALDEKGYFTELTKEGIIFVEDENKDSSVAIHIQIVA